MRIGAPIAICAEPLIRGLAGEAGVAVERNTPRALLSQLQAETLDAALLAPTDALRVPRSRAIPGIGVVFTREAQTELLVSRVAWPHIERVSLDPSAAGLNDWARVILAEWHQAHPAHAAPDSADAHVVTTVSPATFESSAFPHRYDLGILWRQHTGLPFVAMLWIARFGAPLPALRRLLNTAVQHEPSVSYRVGSEAMEGLRLFLRFAERHGFTEGPGELRFC